MVCVAISKIVTAQSWNMTCPPSPQTINACSGNFYDSGGPAGNYLPNLNCVYTLCSNQVGQCVSLNFTQFNVNDIGFFGTVYDYIQVYDGPTTASPPLVNIYGGPFLAPFPLAGTGSCLTFGFVSDVSDQTAGFAATVDCQPCPIPPNATQQDCNGAIPVCQEQYNQPYSYAGNNGSNIIPASSCLANGELNSVWYTYNAQTSGNLSFILTPLYSDDDYDWAVFDITTNGCNGISNGSSPQISCNYSSSTVTWAGQTGAYSGAPYNGVGNNAGAFGQPWNANIPIIAGNTYVIIVSNFSSSQGGYYLDLAPSTANLYDNIPPILNPIGAIPCGANSITLNFSEPVLCSSIQTSDFTVTGPGGPYNIVSFSTPSCTGVGVQFTQSIVLTVAPAFTTSGTYDVNLVGAITDLCGNIAPAASYPFTINTIADAGPNASVCALTYTLAGNNPAPLSGVWSLVSGPGTANFSNASAYNSSVTVSAYGTYTFSWLVTNAGCTVGSDVTITFDSPPVVDVSPISICNGSSGTLTATGATTYTWAPATGLSASTGASVTANPTINTTYTVTGTIGVGCSGTATAIVTVNPTPSVSSALPSYSICSGSSPNINLTPNPAGATLNWTGSDGSSGTGNLINTILNNTVCPNIVITYTVTPSLNGCIGTPIDIPVTVYPNPTSSFTVAPVSVCVNAPVTVTYTGTACPGSTFNWNFPAGTTILSGSGSGPYQLQWANAGNYNLGLQVVSPTGACTSNLTTVPVMVNSAITPDFILPGPYCSGAVIPPLPITSTNGITGTWTPAIDNTTTTTYTFTPTAGQCANNANTTITINPLPVVGVSPSNQNICDGDLLPLNATGADSMYIWSPNTNISSTTSNPVNVNPSVNTTYTVIGTDTNGCTGQASAVITVSPIVTPIFPPIPALCVNDTPPLLPTTSINSITGTWSPSTINTSASGTTTYTFTPNDPIQCGGTITTSVTIDPLPLTTPIFHD